MYITATQRKAKANYWEHRRRAARFLHWFLIGVCVVLGVALLAVPSHAQNLNVRAFPGSTVGAKVTAAQNQCISGLPCVLTFDPELSAFPPGTLPVRCANCFWVDYRTAGAVDYEGNFLAASLNPGGTPWIDVTYYGAKGDGVTDDTAALNAAIAAACPAGKAIFFPQGQWRFASAPNAIGCGAKVLGVGNGSNSSNGTALIADYTEPVAANALLTWDGSSGTANGTGGGIENLTIYKANTRTGGTPIKLTGADDNHRAGFFTIRDVVVSFIGSGSWNKDLVIDGSCCTTAGSQGIRDVRIENFWAAGATDGDSAVLLNNAVQTFWNGGFIFSGTPNPGLTVTGNGSGTQASTNVFFGQLYMTGNFTLDYCAQCYSGNLFVGGNFVSTSGHTGGCGFVGNIGGTITNPSSCLMLTENSSGSLLGSTSFTGGVVIKSSLQIANMLLSATNPTVSSGFGTSPSIVNKNGSAVFTVNVGTGGTASSGVIGLPAAATGWACWASDITTPATNNTKQSAGTTTSVTLTNYNASGVVTAWPASDMVQVSCKAY